jgi:hypothetical protein
MQWGEKIMAVTLDPKRAALKAMDSEHDILGLDLIRVASEIMAAVG